jgi:hypothetical protein
MIKNRLDLQYYLIPESFEVKQATVGKGKKPTQESVTTSYAFLHPRNCGKFGKLTFKRAAACTFSIL